MGVIHPHPFACEAVKVRSEHLTSVTANLFLVLVIGDEEDDVWSIARSPLVFISLLSRCANREY